MKGRTRSYPYSVWPVTFSSASMRVTDFPTTASSSILFSSLIPAKLCRGSLNRLNDLGVTRAAAEIARERKPNLFLRGVLVFVQKRLGHHQHARRAVAALRAAFLNECLLHGMQVGTNLQTLDGYDVRAVQLTRKDKTGVHRLTIQKHGTGTTVARSAAFFRSC